MPARKEKTKWMDKLFVQSVIEYKDERLRVLEGILLDAYACMVEFYKNVYDVFLLDDSDRVIECSDTGLKKIYIHKTFKHESLLRYQGLVLSGEIMGYRVLFINEREAAIQEPTHGSDEEDSPMEKHMRIFVKALKMYIEKNHYYRSVLTGLDAIEDGISILDEAGQLIYANKACFEITGLSREAIGRPVHQFSSGKPVLLNVLEEGKAKIDFEYYLPLKGRLIHLMNSAYPIKSDDHNIVGEIDVFRNIQRSRRLADALAGHHAIYNFDSILGQSPALKEVISHAKTFAKSDKSIMIYGENGTEKELFAQAIHNYSERAASPFVAINCATLPAELIDSELFGYGEGTFTGAKKKGQYGKLELADGGTVFLDEIGEMPIHLQVKLLRVIETKEFTRIGSNKKIHLDIRFLAATNQDLDDLITNGQFRSDLLYRLGVFDLSLPPLRQRQDDILMLVNHFVQKNQEASQKSEIALSKGAIKLLRNYSWPGNIREMENIISRAVYLTDRKMIDVKGLKKCGLSLDIKTDERSQSMQDMTKAHFISVYEKCRGNKKKTAEELGISRPTVYRLLKKYGVSE